MNIFESVFNFFRISGVLPFAFESYPIYVLHKCLVYFLLLFLIVPLFIFAIFEAESFAQFSESFTVSFGIFMEFASFLILIQSKAAILQLIMDLKKIIQNSEFTNFHLSILSHIIS